jgi:hypothetical protein
MRKLKTLGVALVAVFALSAVASASASAASFNAETVTAVLAGGQTTTHEFTVAAGTTKCTSASFPGEQTTTPATTISVSPAYSGCSTVILGSTHGVNVNMHSCKYTFAAASTTSGSVSVECPSTPITVEIEGLEGVCSITVPSQSAVAGITYANEGTGSARKVLVTANVSTLHYTQHGAFCPGNNFEAEKSFTTGVYKGSTRESATAKVGGAADGIFLS